MKHLRTAAFAATVAVAGAIAFQSAPVSGQAEELTPRQLRVIWTENPSSEATISWTTTEPGSEHALHYDVEPRGGTLADYSASVAVSESGAYVDEGPYFHHARLTGLEPDTEYHFVVETDGNTSTELWFRTAHDDDRAFKLVYGGDSRSGYEDRQRMNRLIADVAEDDEVVAMVHGGDYIDWANTWWQWSRWLDDHQLTIGEDGRVLPIVPAKGNHEGRGMVYNRVFADPGGSAEVNWFFTQIGDLSLINLDTEVSLAGDQRDWLETKLAEGRESDWLAVNYHRPAFPAVKSPSGAREHWVPLFEEYDVDIVCESDGHTLKRTPPIRNEQVDFTGVTYVGEGGLGVPQRTPKTDRWYLQSPGMAASAHHVQVLEFGEDLIRYQAVLESGDVADEVTIQRREARLAQTLTAAMAEATSPYHVEVMMTGAFDAETLTTDSVELSPDVEVRAVSPRPVVADVLRFVNEATFEQLDDDASLDRRAAQNIIELRAGDDGETGTDDDQTIGSWAELDDVSYVGPSALENLVEHTDGMYENPRNAFTVQVDGLEKNTMYSVLLSGIATPDGEEVAAGTTVSFTFTDDSPADSFGAPEEEAAGGCSTTQNRPVSGSFWLLIAVVVWRLRPWTSRR